MVLTAIVLTIAELVLDTRELGLGTNKIMENDNKYNFKIIIPLIILIIVFLAFLTYKPKNNIQVKTSENTSESNASDEVGIRNENILSYTESVLNALNSYYLATITYPDENNSDVLSATMFSYMEQNRYLNDGNGYLSSCLKDKSKIIQMVCGGMTLGANQVIKANETMISFLRNIDPSDPKISQEVSYRIAENLSSQKEGYKNIYIYAPQIGYLYFKPAQSENPSGEIPYLVTKEERETILNGIKSRFSGYIKEDDLNHAKTGSSNAIILAVKQIQSYLIHDTYEQSNSN